MKELLTLLIIVFAWTMTTAQTGDTTLVNYKDFTIQESMPEFPKMHDSLSGEVSLIHFLIRNLIYPLEAKAEGVEGIVYTSFTVDKDGNVINPRITKGVNPILDGEALNLIELMPKWKPGTSNGNPVSVSYNLPVRFELRSGVFKFTVSKQDLSKESYKSAGRFVAVGNYTKAILLYSKAIDYNRHSRDAFYNRGVCYYKLGKMDKACEDWQNAKKMGDRESKKFLKKYCD